ncbi:MAG: bifunctional phosphopantothenoylcysteine decarboxylase/phosphopantothenate--cysteine ligase CoaBC [Armatimonadota bacterium]
MNERLAERDLMENRRIILGVTGSIAAYKTCGLVTRLKRRGAGVRVIMTENATRLVSPQSFAALSGEPVKSDLWGDRDESGMDHISLQEFGEALVVSPATANIIGKVATGIADDLVSTAIMAATCPVGFAPAMNTHMWQSPAVVENVQTLRERGYWFCGPVSGRLASGDSGAGRLATTDQIIAVIERMLIEQQPTAIDLKGRKVVITGGPTREYLDPVRFLSNPSSGKMGYALAQQAAAAGANVVLVSGPGTLSQEEMSGENLRVINVVSAEEMFATVNENIDDADVFIAAAAVADYAPARRSAEKIKKTDEDLTLALQSTPDILKSVATGDARPQFVVGFAAESADLHSNARRKLEEKNLDLIAANSVVEDGSGFGVDTNRVTLFGPDEFRRELPLMSKWAVADIILDHVASRLQ